MKSVAVLALVGAVSATYGYGESYGGVKSSSLPAAPVKPSNSSPAKPSWTKPASLWPSLGGSYGKPSTSLAAPVFPSSSKPAVYSPPPVYVPPKPKTSSSSTPASPVKPSSSTSAKPTWPKSSGKPSSSKPVISSKPSGKPTWPEGGCETKTYETIVTDIITKTITASKGTDSWPEVTSAAVISTKKVTVTVSKTWATSTPYAAKPSAPAKPVSPVVPYVPKPYSYSKVTHTTAAPVATGSAYVKPSYYKPAATTTKAYKPLEASANAAVKNSAAGAGMIAAAMLAFF